MLTLQQSKHSHTLMNTGHLTHYSLGRCKSITHTPCVLVRKGVQSKAISNQQKSIS